ncbi:MAG: lactate utilization protein [Deferribacteres bacterium]|nr:lactate utilization protein [Deferribacteres bacterium]
MSSRDRILQNLQVPNSLKKESSQPFQDSSIYSDYPEKTKEELIEAFRAHFLALNGEFFHVRSKEEAAERVAELLHSVEGNRYLVDSNPLCRDIFSSVPELEKQFDDITKTSLEAMEFAEYSIGLTSADFLVARTGSIVLRSSIAAGRRLSVLPPLHIVVATVEQIVPSLDAALQNSEFRNGEWSYGTIITGPSRTSDIEKILVLGAHGPKRLALILLDA